MKTKRSLSLGIYYRSLPEGTFREIHTVLSNQCFGILLFSCIHAAVNEKAGEWEEGQGQDLKLQHQLRRKRYLEKCPLLEEWDIRRLISI